MAHDTRPPAQPATKSVWTPEDEARLTELQERRNRIFTAHMENLVDAVKTGFYGDTSSRLYSAMESGADHVVVIAEALRANARMIRDALIPFDGR